MLRELFGDDYEFDLTVRSLNDDKMLQVMAQKNMQEWHTSPIVVTQTVKVTKEYLEGKFTPKGVSFASGEKIADFLDWPLKRVDRALRLLRASGQIPEVKNVRAQWVEEKEIKKVA